MVSTRRTLAFLICGLGWMTSLRAETILGPVEFDLGVTESESIAVAGFDRFLFVTSAEEVSPDVFSSSVPVLLHLPRLPGSPVRELFAVQFGGGEVTDVVVHPFGVWGVANIRDDDANDINQLALFRGNRVKQRIDLPESADGIALSKNGRRIGVAVEKGEAIQIYDTGGLRGRLELLATIDREDMVPFFTGEEARIVEEIEPESAKFSPDGSLLVVSLQEQSSLAVIDVASLQLVNMVHLPFDFLDTRGDPIGVSPDGFSFTPDGGFLFVANEANSRSRHLAGLSIVDLRGGPLAIPEPRTLCIFDIDPSLLDDSGFATCPEAGPGGEPPANHGDLPRIDPNNTATVERGGKLITAINMERPPLNESTGSVLFLDMSAVPGGGDPQVIDRRNVRISGRPEGLATSDNGRFLWVAIETDGGRIARFEIP